MLNRSLLMAAAGSKRIVSGGSDPYWSNVVALLHFDGADGATSIVDNSNNPLSFSAHGTASLNTSTKKFGSSSLFLDGSSWISSSYSSKLDLPGDFTIETFAYLTSGSGVQVIVSRQQDDGVSMAMQLRVNSGKAEFVMRSINDQTVYVLASPSTIPTSQWVHLAASRSGSDVGLFVDGLEVASVTSSANLSNATHGILVGANDGNNPGSSGWLNGYVDELRITKGVARYTSNFTPPTAPFPNS